jgi:hypothetical protein
VKKAKMQGTEGPGGFYIRKLISDISKSSKIIYSSYEKINL